jgi:hypothetical protein
MFSAVELGVYTSYAGRLGPLEVVDSRSLQAPLALCTVRMKRDRKKIWISLSYDKVRGCSYPAIKTLL